jgi:hypothetical protein
MYEVKIGRLAAQPGTVVYDFTVYLLGGIIYE